MERRRSRGDRSAEWILSYGTPFEEIILLEINVLSKIISQLVKLSNYL